MNSDLQQSFIRGVERLTAWADILNSINVFPVADGDTGHNLVVSLTPLLKLNHNRDEAVRRLLLSARGNSGNIAASFFSGFLMTDSSETLFQSAMTGRDRAWKAVADPKPGTMLTIFDALADSLRDYKINEENVTAITDRLEKAVRATSETLPQLRKAKVVDSGALGMFIYLETFLKHLVGKSNHFKPIGDAFRGMLEISPDYAANTEHGYCVNMTVNVHRDSDNLMKKIPEYGEHAVISSDKNCLKIHLHTDDKNKLKEEIESLGTIMQWADERIEPKEKFHPSSFILHPSIHIMTDAAGSLTREECDKSGITLLDSYISIGETSLPETFLTPSELYEPMKKGIKVSTSQASVFERHQHYQSVLDRYRKVLYLCVGSAFTGNYDVVTDWKQSNDPEDRLKVLDTHAASGRLGMIVLATRRFAAENNDAEAVITFAEKAIEETREFVFLDKLKYLAAGGRLSKTGAFMGDVFHMKPVISPTKEGAKKVGMVRNSSEQIMFAIEKLNQSLKKDSKPFIMLEYSDNRSWVDEVVQKKIRAQYPEAEIILQPLSLTSGAHMGPGTWAVAFISS